MKKLWFWYKFFRLYKNRIRESFAKAILMENGYSIKVQSLWQSLKKKPK